MDDYARCLFGFMLAASQYILDLRAVRE